MGPVGGFDVAADMHQKAGVVGLRRRGRIDVEDLTEPHGDQRGLEPMLEGESHCEIGGQAGRRDHLGSAHLIAV
jgi:hypothetical protein